MVPSAMAAAGAGVVMPLGLLEEMVDIVVIFQHKAGGAANGIRRQIPNAQCVQRSGPIQRLGDGGFLQNGIAGAGDL